MIQKNLETRKSKTEAVLKNVAVAVVLDGCKKANRKNVYTYGCIMVC